MKLTITKLRNLYIDEFLKPDRDYGIMLIGSIVGEYIPQTHDDSAPEKTYFLEVERVDGIFDLKEKTQIEARQSRLTPSQNIRYIIEQELGNQEYAGFQEWFIANQLHGQINEYRESLSNN